MNHPNGICNLKNELIHWVKEHKTQLELLGLSVAVIIPVILGFKNKDTIYKMFNELKRLLEPPKYSPKWFDALSDEQLEIEREIIRKKYCASGNDFKAASTLYCLLNRFDVEMRGRSKPVTDYHGPVHREHGWHLPEKD